ncbi:MAG: ABC transporter permease [Herpetosiphonaceae bacterium]|nr:MAG: ABC transporter permease [Herpetosiphonaceae bacterium]
MRNLLRAYRSLIKAALITFFEYRAQVIIWVISFIFPLVMMVVWLAIVSEAGQVSGWGRSDFVAYYVGAAIVHQFTQSWATWEWEEQIRTGDLSFKLLKPLDPFHHIFTQIVGSKLFLLTTVLPIVLGLIWLAPGINYTLSPARLAACVAAVIGGFMVSMLMSTAFGMLSFWTTQSGNLYGLWYGVGNFLSGFIAPLALFPAWMQKIALVMPFRSTMGLPVEILVGRLDWAGIWLGLGITAAWMTIFTIIYRLLWRRGIRHYDAVGA